MVKKIIVLGGSGMLGSMLVDDLSRDAALKITATVRSQAIAEKCKARVPEANWVTFDAEAGNGEKALKIVSGHDWVINAIGFIRSYIHDENPQEVERAIRLNSLLPHELARKAAKAGARVIQIATDCVYSGKKGNYTESDLFDPLDVYGKSKNLGEVHTPGFFHMRTSIVGPVLKGHAGLLSWFLSQPENASVDGYTNHWWNGMTTLHFSRLCHAVISGDIQLPHTQHIIPSGEITKYELLRLFAHNYHREDISIRPFDTPVAFNTILKTNNESLNSALWASAGYNKPPTIPEMIAEMAGFNYKFTGV